MAKNRKITTLEFEYLLNLKEYVHESDEKAKKEVKYALLNAVKGVFGDSWYNLKDKTKQAIDYICFLSVERGFFYAKPETIANYASVSKSTIYEALKSLRENGILRKANRASRKHNGLGTPIHFFTIHPYFNHICEYLNVDWNSERKADWKAENAEILCGSKAENNKNISTYNLPTYSPNKDNVMYIHSNVHSNNSEVSELVDKGSELVDKKASEYVDNHIQNVEHVKKCKIYKYVPRMINNLFAETLGEKLVTLWRKIAQAFRSIKSKLLTKKDMQEVGRSVLKFLIKSKNFLFMTLDEMCRYVYKGAVDAFYNLLATQYLMDMKEIDGQMHYMNADGDYVPTYDLDERPAFSIKVDKDKLPDVLKYDFINEDDTLIDCDDSFIDDSFVDDNLVDSNSGNFVDIVKEPEVDYKSKLSSLWDWVKQSVSKNNPLDWSQHLRDTSVGYDEHSHVVHFRIDGAWSTSVVREIYGNWLNKLVKYYFGSEWDCVIESRL
jgi:hypothetical protein